MAGAFLSEKEVVAEFEMVRAFGGLNFVPSVIPTAYHYCPTEAACENHPDWKIRATDVAFLNDPTE